MSPATRVWRVDAEHPEPGPLEEAAALLRDGRLVAFPTETVYGLGAHALEPQAVARIFEAKGRPADNPLIVHVAGVDMLSSLVRDVPPAAKVLMEAFWPGPLTLVMARHEAVPAVTSAGLDSVAVRMPAHPVAHGLIVAAGVPVAAPSANRSGRPSPTRAKHVLADLDGRIDAVVDGGACGIGLESTVVDVRRSPIRVLRLGGLSVAELEGVAGAVEVDPHAVGAPVAADVEVASPGVRHRHYAPEARLVAVEGTDRVDRLRRLWEAHTPGVGVGFLVSDELAGEVGMQGDDVVSLGRLDDPAAMARCLYGRLRGLDAAAFRLVYLEVPPGDGVLAAVADRLRRAARSDA